MFFTPESLSYEIYIVVWNTPCILLQIILYKLFKFHQIMKTSQNLQVVVKMFDNELELDIDDSE